MSIRVILGLGLIASAGLALADDTVQLQPDLDGLVRAGLKTQERLKIDSASWTATTQLPNGAVVSGAVLSTPISRRTVLTVQLKGQTLGGVEVIARDGLWYVKDGERRVKCRPNEMSFAVSSMYVFLMRCELRFIPEEITAKALGKFEKTENGVAEFRTPLAEAMHKQYSNLIAEMETMMSANASMANNPETKLAMKRLREAIRGIMIRVDVKNGLIMKFGATERPTEIRDFRWLDQVNPNDFAVNRQQWEDYSDDPTSGNLDDLLMINHNPSWKPGMKAGDSDACLFDASTGRYRRIPFQGIAALPGCFLKDRRRVVVTGVDDAGVLAPFEVNLKTGENRRLGGEAFASGQSFMPALSPDGKTIAILHKEPEGPILNSQMYLIDLESGNSRRFGKQHEYAFLSWLPSGKGLVALKRAGLHEPQAKPVSDREIVRIDLDENVTPIGEGDMPVLLNDGKTLLFDVRGADGWQTSDVDGRNRRQYGDGLSGYSFPTPAPDGRRMLFMRFEKGKAPVPMVMPLGASEGRPLTEMKGLWSLPAWR